MLETEGVGPCPRALLPTGKEQIQKGPVRAERLGDREARDTWPPAVVAGWGRQQERVFQSGIWGSGSGPQAAVGAGGF